MRERSKRLWRRKWFRRMVFLLPFLGMGFYILHFHLPLLIVEIDTPANKVFSEEAAPGVKDPMWDQRLSVQSSDGLRITSGVMKADSAKGTVILLHGIRAGKEQFAQMAVWLKDNGWNAVAMDMRAHGESQGRFCSYGLREKEDLSAVLDLLEKEGFQAPFGVWGHSLGGAVALQSLEHDERLTFGVVESTFSDLRKVIKEYFTRFTGLEWDWLTEYQISRAEAMAEFQVDQVCPSQSCKGIRQPVLLIHGDKDDRIGIDHALRNFRCLSSAQKELYVVEGATHIDVWSVGGEVFLTRVHGFLEKKGLP